MDELTKIEIKTAEQAKELAAECRELQYTASDRAESAKAQADADDLYNLASDLEAEEAEEEAEPERTRDADQRNRGTW
jgi:hypothetical protein